ncbi:MAG: hypothetical protein E5X38_16045 [Mesorhizobium sp.]|uniref:hypothetical protein n=1 Tax=Mesorhizobium sp. TaxID=1871066 RepID=UPI0011FC1D16|nr:hypothetical protein [Mesorhizobium sp.]TIQ86460.1 MAG: hypothetical protein E5X38_16045 [Mesorhizobium sp.]TIQ96686.1 MAG: hypothetical protein E5X36_19195 [Mesorhizobium sp.]
MKAPTDDLNDLQSDIGHLAHLMDVLTNMVIELPRDPGGRTMADQATALAWIARDMAEMLVEEAGLCHARVIAEMAEARSRKRGGSLQ